MDLQPTIRPIRQTLEARLLSKIHNPVVASKSDIDQYFDNPLAQIIENISKDLN